MNFFVFILFLYRKQPIISCEYSDDAIRRRTYSPMFQLILKIDIITTIPLYWPKK